MAGESYTDQKPIGVAPAGYHTVGHTANPKRFSNVFAEGLTWVRKQLPTPGAMNYAFDTLALAESTPIGPGVRQRIFWGTVATPLFLPAVQRPTSGYGGVAQGQFIAGGLFDPYSNQYGNIMGPNV